MDFKSQHLLPHKVSTLGPKVAVADVNNDGIEDVYIGGAKGSSGQCLIQDKSGDFKMIWESDNYYEDIGVQFFDADNDGDQD